jgi:hypothetical protein
MFKADKKKALITKIKLYRERGGSYSEIANALNKDGMLTPNGKEWRPSYLFSFYDKNKKSAV